MTETTFTEPVPPAEPIGSAESAASGRARARWQLWRSPHGQPAWSRPVLLVIAALAALLYGWNIAHSGYAYFYSTAVKSMSVSWKAFFYGALDPGATVTIDKLAGSFLPQALSARVFGFHQWSLTLPQVIEGVVSVLVIHRIVRRWAGAVPAVLAAGLFALTPVLASMFGHPMEDGALTMCLVLAADSYQRAVLEGRLRSLLLAGMWVGLGFQAKMMQAWIVLPALAVGYLFTAPPKLRRRLLDLLLAGIVAAAVSFSWILLYTLTPANDRPYIDGSTNNSAVSMVFGYNGFGRFGVSVAGSVTGFGTGGGGPRGNAPGGGFEPPGGARGEFPGGGPGGAGGNGFNPPGGTTAGPDADASAGGGQLPGGPIAGGGGGANIRLAGQATGLGKLFTGRFVTQIGWLYPLAFAALLFGLAGWLRRRRRADRLGTGLLMWGVWLATTMIVFSKIDIPHTAYMATLAPPLVALSGFGIVEFWRAYRRGGIGAWTLPAVIAGQAGWTIYLDRDYSSFVPWLTPAVIAAAAAAVLTLVVGLLARRAPDRLPLARFGHRARLRLAVTALAAGVAAMVLMPTAWSLSVFNSRDDGSAFDASAGPSGGGFGMTATATLTAQQTKLLAYLDAHRGSARYVMATTSWNTAAPYIEATGQKVLPMGGFSGSVPEPTLAAFKQLVHSGQLKFVMVATGGGFGGGNPGGSGTSTVSSITTWVQSACATVPAADYGGTTSATSGSANPFQPGGGGGTGILYQCLSSAR
jgi:4-amino-4-deoxy-L-arabinose transferase-like glycosyltransferase